AKQPDHASINLQHPGALHNRHAANDGRTRCWLGVSGCGGGQPCDPRFARTDFTRAAADCVTNSFQMRAGRSPPVTPLVGVLSSLPIHTPTTMSLVNPMNHASL